MSEMHVYCLVCGTFGRHEVEPHGTIRCLTCEAWEEAQRHMDAQVLEQPLPHLSAEIEGTETPDDLLEDVDDIAVYQRLRTRRGPRLRLLANY